MTDELRDAIGLDGGGEAESAAEENQHAPGQIGGGLPVHRAVAIAVCGQHEKRDRCEHGHAAIGEAFEWLHSGKRNFAQQAAKDPQHGGAGKDREGHHFAA